jgi:hypothetical protein
LDVLPAMIVTAAVSHFEMSALNAAAPQNAVGVYMSMQLMLNPNTKKEETQNCQRTTSS